MSKENEDRIIEFCYTQNRELSWLRFNRRVLEEANDNSVPALERLKFVAIFSSNLDEFFMVRVGSLFDMAMVSPDESDNKTGMTPKEQLGRIYSVIPELIRLKRQIYASVISELNRYGIYDLDYSELNSDEQTFVDRYFKQSILPIISPSIVGSHHPIPHLVNKQLYVAAMIEDKKGKTAFGIVPVSENIPEYIQLPNSEQKIIRTENIILHWASALFGSYQVIEACIISITRNADISFDEDKFDANDKDFRSRVATLLKKRDSLSAMRLEIDRKISGDFSDLLLKVVQVGKKQTYTDACPLNMKYVY